MSSNILIWEFEKGDGLWKNTLIDWQKILI